MKQIIGKNLADMSQEELLSLSDQIFEEINKRNNRGLEYGQKVLINGKYANHPSLYYEIETRYGKAEIDNRYTGYVGTIAYVRDPKVHDEEDSLPFVTLKTGTSLRASKVDVHPDDIVVLGYVGLEEYKPRLKNKQ